MFGTHLCSSRSWWPNFKSRYPRALEDAPRGVVPQKVGDVVQSGTMAPPSDVPFPTKEFVKRASKKESRRKVSKKERRKRGSKKKSTRQAHAGTHNSSRLSMQNRQPVIHQPEVGQPAISLKEEPMMEDIRPIKVEAPDQPQLGNVQCDDAPDPAPKQAAQKSKKKRTNSKDLGQEKSAKKSRRNETTEEQAVATGEQDPEWSEFITNASKRKRSQERATFTKKMKEHIKQQDELVSELATLVREQQERIQGLEIRQNESEEWHECVDRRMLAMRKTFERK